MEVKTFTHPHSLIHVPGNLVAFDLELANSFPSGPGVICMIGLEHYDPVKGQSEATIAFIREREKEKELIEWLLGYLGDFRRQHTDARLVTFSGTDNDIPWIRERLVRLDIQEPGQSVLAKMGNLDLKLEFYRRTQNIKISLKRLEEIFGIHRASSITSKKVSYVLTDILRNHRKKTEIPPRLFDYLAEDVHNLLVIYDRWGETPLERFNFTDAEFDELLISLSRTIRKFSNSPRIKRADKKELGPLLDFAERLEQESDRSRAERSFRTFALPDFPRVTIRHAEFDRILKKFNYLKSLEVVDAETGAYRLKAQMFRGQGALIVLRHEGRVLMIRRSDRVERAPGFWGLPGGVVEPDETVEECAVRELQEELNLEGQVVGVLGNSSSFSGEYELTWVEVAVDDLSTLRPRPEEVSVVRWITPEEIRELKPLIPGAVEGFSEFLGG